MNKHKLLASGVGLALIAACTPAPEPICDRDVKIDKYGNVELAECQMPQKPGIVARGPFPFGLFGEPSQFDLDALSDRSDRRSDSSTGGAAPVVLTDGGELPSDGTEDPGVDNPAPPPAGDDDTSTNGGGSDGDGGTPTNGGGGSDDDGGTPTNGGGGSDDDGGTPTNGGGGSDDDDQSDDPETQPERKRLHHALRDATKARRNVNYEEIEIREELANTPSSDAERRDELRAQERALRTERKRLQEIEDARREEFDNFINASAGN